MIHLQRDLLKIKYPGFPVIQNPERTLHSLVLQEWSLRIIERHRLNQAIQIQVESQDLAFFILRILPSSLFIRNPKNLCLTPSSIVNRALVMATVG